MFTGGDNDELKIAIAATLKFYVLFRLGCDAAKETLDYLAVRA